MFFCRVTALFSHFFLLKNDLQTLEPRGWQKLTSLDRHESRGTRTCCQQLSVGYPLHTMYCIHRIVNTVDIHMTVRILMIACIYMTVSKEPHDSRYQDDCQQRSSWSQVSTWLSARILMIAGMNMTVSMDSHDSRYQHDCQQWFSWYVSTWLSAEIFVIASNNMPVRILMIAGRYLDR
jgi:hypothetical protein